MYLWIMFKFKKLNEKLKNFVVFYYHEYHSALNVCDIINVWNFILKG